jgi:tight adherence protein B
MSGPAATGAVIGLAAGCGVLLVLMAWVQPRPARPLRTGTLRRLVRQADLPRLTPLGLVAASLACALLAFVVVLVVTAVPVAALMAALVAGSGPILTLRRRAAARRRELRAAWPDAVDDLTSAVRAGLSLPEAVAELGRSGPAPLRSAFAAFGVEYRATGSFSSSLSLLEDRLADPVADRVLSAVRLAREFGGTELGVVLRTLSGMLREDARTRGEIEARQSWTVSAARMAVAAPWLTLALLCTRPEAVAAYATAAGAVVIVLAASLSVAAYAVMMRIGRLPGDDRWAGVERGS